METDEYVGFMTISAEDIDDIGIAEVIKRIRDRVGSNPVYLTSVLHFLLYVSILTLFIFLRSNYRLDIDVIDPSIAPASQSFSLRLEL